MSDSISTAQQESQSIKFRRGIGFLLMSLVLPGSVQLFSGNSVVGKFIVRVWLVILAFFVLLGFGAFFARGYTLGFFLNPVVLTLGKFILWTYVICWVLLLLDGVRRGLSLAMARPARLGLSLGAIVMSGVLIFAGSVVSRGMTAASDIGSIFQGGGDSHREAGRLNVLLLGADSGPSRVGLRPDSITVASIDAETGRTVLFSLPRNLQGAPFPKSNPLHEKYPDGFRCDNHECMLNGVYTLAHDNEKLFSEGGEDVGIRTMKDVVGEILGLKINYYAMVDLQGFRELIDAMGGIRLDINRRIPIGGVSTKVSGYIEPGKNVLLDGHHALWFARSRHDSNDYDRMARQKCVMAAMLKQLDPATVATRFSELAAASKSVVETDVATTEIPDLVDLALLAKELKIRSVSFVPPLIKPHDPDFRLIRERVISEVRASQALDAPQPTASASPSESAEATSSPTPTPTESVVPEDPGQTDNLDVVCKVS